MIYTRVVIIGGGYGGMELASILKKWNIPFTLIDPKEYFHHNVGALRAVVDEGKFHNISGIRNCLCTYITTFDWTKHYTLILCI